jgi:adenylate kinase
VYIGLNIVVTGTPGVGKTRFSKALANKLGLRYVPLDDILIEERLVSGYDPLRGSYIVDIERGRRYVRDNIELVDVVIDSHIAILLVPCEDIDMCFVLRCDPYILLDRLLNKGFDKRKALENVQAEILDIILIDVIGECGREKVIQLDVSGGVDKYVDSVVEAVDGGYSLGSHSIDWLSKIIERGDLDKFFPPE